jgi:sugar lactone lactonase YvrE
MKVTNQFTTSIHIFLLVIIVSNSYGQPAYKMRSATLNGPDGIVVDRDDNVFIANWGRDAKGTTVIQIDKNEKEAIYLDSLSSPDGLAFDKNGNLYVSCFASGQIIKITPGKKREIYASGLDHPSDIKFNAAGELFVSCFGNFDGTKVLKITSLGRQTVFVDSLSVPLGLVFDKNQDLYVSNFASGIIYRVDKSGQKKVYAQLPNTPAGYFQYLAFDSSGNLYCPSFGHDCIYKIEQDGRISRLFISNENGDDKVLNGPNSVFIKGRYLYFTEFNTNSVYRVKLDR